jgi:hypothetical protein
VTALPWTEQNIVDDLAGALTAVSSYLAFRTDSEVRIVAAVADQLTGPDIALLETLLNAAQPEETST